MGNDNLGIGKVHAEELSGTLGDETVAGAVEAVAADLVVVVVLVSQAVEVSLLGHGLVEGGVEYANHGNAGHGLLAGSYADKVGGIVQGCKVVALFHCCDNLRGDDNGAGELLAAVYKAMANSANLI